MQPDICLCNVKCYFSSIIDLKCTSSGLRVWLSARALLSPLKKTGMLEFVLFWQYDQLQDTAGAIAGQSKPIMHLQVKGTLCSVSPVVDAWETGKKETTPGRSMPSGSPSKWISILFLQSKRATLLECSLDFWYFSYPIWVTPKVFQ